MKKIIYLLLISCISFAACNQKQEQKGKQEQTEGHDKELMARLEGMLKVTEQKDFDKILDYTYPKVFKFASREQLKEALKAGFEAEEFTTSLDSVTIKKIHPVFVIQDTQYAKIIHTLRMHMKYKEKLDTADLGNFVNLMEMQFGKVNVAFDVPSNTLLISTSPQLVAIKDKNAKEWNFVNYNEADQLAPMLFSAEVIRKLAEYK